MLECHGMEVGLHPLSFVVDGVDFIAAAVDLDATDRPALRRELLLERFFRLPAAFRAGITRG